MIVVLDLGHKRIELLNEERKMKLVWSMFSCQAGSYDYTIVLTTSQNLEIEYS
jgi:hypothetical protein